MISLMLTVWLILSAELYWAERLSGPYEVLMEKLTRCDDEGTREVVVSTKIIRTSTGIHVYNDTVYIGRLVEQDFSMNLKLQSFSNGGYRPRYMHHTFKGCEENWKYFTDFLKTFRLEGAKIQGCPIQAGNYTTENLLTNMNFINSIPVMRYNKYRAVFTTYYKGKKSGCVQAYLEVTPK